MGGSLLITLASWSPFVAASKEGLSQLSAQLQSSCGFSVENEMVLADQGVPSSHLITALNISKWLPLSLNSTLIKLQQGPGSQACREGKRTTKQKNPDPWHKGWEALLEFLLGSINSIASWKRLLLLVVPGKADMKRFTQRPKRVCVSGVGGRPYRPGGSRVWPARFHSQLPNM